MRVAFKEWAIVVDALGRGDQILILRKGGIAEGKGGFQPEYPEFLLFPTSYHQQRESVVASAQRRYDEIAATFPGPGVVRVEFLAKVMDWRKLDSLAAVERLRGQHVWRDEVVAQRFAWGKQKNLYALALRIHRLPQKIACSMRPSYGGCKSWVELEEEVPVQKAIPVLNKGEFEEKLRQFKRALGRKDGGQ
jgi:hypothetical protein